MTDTDEAVERAARAIELRLQSTWSHISYDSLARAALAAADGGEVERLRAALDRAASALAVGGMPNEAALARAALHADKEGTVTSYQAERDRRFTPGNDEIWGKGEWERCAVCPLDSTGHEPYHHRLLHADREGTE